MRLTKFKIWGLLVLAAALVGAAAWFYSKGRQAAPVFVPPAEYKIHYAGNKDVGINQISVRAVYFVPKDQALSENKSWQPALDAALSKVKDFYQAQLQNSVKINFQIYPAAVIGQNDSMFYDGTTTSAGNPNALMAIQEELHSRLLSPGGDLYRGDFATDHGFNILAIIYEGVGSGGTLDQDSNFRGIKNSADLPVLLLSRSFLTDDQYQDFGLTFLAHELGHTLGLGDNYDTKTGQPYGDDLMGSGRFRPLIYNYLSQDDKNLLGIQ